MEQESHQIADRRQTHRQCTWERPWYSHHVVCFVQKVKALEERTKALEEEVKEEVKKLREELEGGEPEAAGGEPADARGDARSPIPLMLPSAALPTSALPITHIGATTYGPPFPLLRHRRTAGEGSTTAYASGVPGRGRHGRPLEQCTRQSYRHVEHATRPA